MTTDEFVFIKVGNGHGYVLLFAAGIGEAEVYKLDFVFFHHFHHVCDGLCHQILLVGWLVKKVSGLKCRFCANLDAAPQGLSPLLCIELPVILCKANFAADMRHVETTEDKNAHYWCNRDLFQRSRTNSGPSLTASWCKPSRSAG